jgi:hypothetical protein
MFVNYKTILMSVSTRKDGYAVPDHPQAGPGPIRLLTRAVPF